MRWRCTRCPPLGAIGGCGRPCGCTCATPSRRTGPGAFWSRLGAICRAVCSRRWPSMRSAPATCSAFWWGMRMPSPPRTRLSRPNAPHARARSLRPFICAWSSGPRRARHFWPTATGPLASRHRCGPASTRCWWPIRPASSRRCPLAPLTKTDYAPARQRDRRFAGGRFVALRRRVPVGPRVARQDARVRLGHDARALGGARRRQIGLRRGDTRRHRPTRRG